MRDITQEMRTQDFQRALRQYGQLGLGMAEAYARRSEADDDPESRARTEGVSEGLAILAEALISAAEWDSPDRHTRTKVPEDPTLDARRSWQSYYNAGLPWTGELEDAVNRGEVDVS